MQEYYGATDGGRRIKDIARDQMKLIFGDAELQRFILARALMTATALSGPLYVALAQRSGGRRWITLAGCYLRQGWRALSAAHFGARWRVGRAGRPWPLGR